MNQANPTINSTTPEPAPASRAPLPGPSGRSAQFSNHLTAFLALALSACKGPSAPAPTPSDLAPSAAVAPADPPLAVPSAPPARPASSDEPVAEPAAPSRAEPKAPAALEGEDRVDLEVEGFRPAVVRVPVGASGKRPVLVATHGNYDTPFWQCEVWGHVVAGRGFVLCPRGIPRRDSPSPQDVRFEYATNTALEKEVMAGLDALAARFPDHVDRERVIYAGFSLGSIMGAAIARRRPALFPRLALVEGGYEGWSAQSAKAFKAAGGERALFACGQGGCVASSNQAARTLSKAGVEARVVAAPGEGHSYGGKVAAQIEQAFGWLVEGDERWGAAR